jgi:hypothetical protein
MENGALVMGFTIWTLEILKSFFVPKEQKEAFKQLVPGVTVLLAMVYNILFCGLLGGGFGMPAIQAAARDGLEFSVIASGIYGMGKSALGKS